jgi:hypothetical protein
LVWGATDEEVARRYPSDGLMRGGVAMTRAIGVEAPSELVWRWLCQMAVAPYSYDWTAEHHGTGGSAARIVGRLVAGLSGPLCRVRAHALAWGDLVMTRRQFRNFEALAERDAIALGH